jgi:hypothetical protein
MFSYSMIADVAAAVTGDSFLPIRPERFRGSYNIARASAHKRVFAPKL